MGSDAVDSPAQAVRTRQLPGVVRAALYFQVLAVFAQAAHAGYGAYWQWVTGAGHWVASYEREGVPPERAAQLGLLGRVLRIV